MIPFKMKILKYNPGTLAYTVEYIPKNSNCNSITLEIHLNVNNPEDMDEVLTSLKNSCPQDYWRQEILKATPNHSALQSLVNTEHEITGTEYHSNTVSGNSSPIESGLDVDSEDSYIVQSVSAPRRGGQQRYRGTPDQIATPGEISNVRLKLAIQKVLREMAEGTV